MNFFEGTEAEKLGAFSVRICPEHIDVSTTEGQWKGKVGVAEPLGSDTSIHVHGIPGCDPLTVRAGGEVGVKHGDNVFVTPRLDMIHKFNADGLRVS